MWPPAAHPQPNQPPCVLSKVRALIAGQEAWMGGLRVLVVGFSGHPGPIPKNLRVSAYSAPPAPALKMCSVKPWRRECPKHSADESGGDRVGIHPMIINPWGLSASLRAHAAFGIRKSNNKQANCQMNLSAIIGTDYDFVITPLLPLLLPTADWGRRAAR